MTTSTPSSTSYATCFCTKCCEHKPVEDFYRTNRLNTKGTCKKCWAAYIGSRRSKTKQSLSIKERVDGMEVRLSELAQAIQSAETSLGFRLKQLETFTENFSSQLDKLAQNLPTGPQQGPQQGLSSAGLEQAYTHLCTMYENLRTDMQALKNGAGNPAGTLPAALKPAPPASTPETSTPAPPDTKPLRAAIAQSLADPYTPVPLDTCFLLNGATFTYGLNKAMDTGNLKPYTTAFDPVWRQMHKEDRLARMQEEQDDPLANL